MLFVVFLEDNLSESIFQRSSLNWKKEN